MYRIKTDAGMSINSKYLLQSDEEALENLLRGLQIHPNFLTDMIMHIQEWYKKEPHLPEGELHDQLIARLLIMRKCSLEKVKEKLDNYLSVRHNMDEVLSKRDPMAAEVNTYLKSGYWIVLPRKTPENHRVTILRIKPCNNNISVINIIKVIFMIADYRLWNDTVVGEHCILDFENVTVQLAMQLSPAMISKIVFYVTSCLGPKLKGLHLINLPFYAATAFDLFKKLIKPKLVKRIHVYNNFKDVMDMFPKSIFPKDLAGTDDVTCQEITDAWLVTLSSPTWRKYFIDQDFIRSDEAKRITLKHNTDHFGVKGSFKQLNID